MISFDRLRANRRNAQKSTGPRTDRGKARSRQNALKHGLTGAGVVQPADEAAERDRRMASWTAELQPSTEMQVWVVGQLILATLRLDRSARLETAQRGLTVERAGCCWRNDRRLETEQLATRLTRNPALVVRQLSTTSQGCDWLIARWESLAIALAEQGHWDDLQRSLAYDLLGVPPLERPCEDRIRDESSRDELLAVVQEEIQWLDAQKAEGLDDLDSTEQALAEADLKFDISPPARLLRRYESASRQTFFWGLNLLRRCRREALEEAIDEREDDLDDLLPPRRCATPRQLDLDPPTKPRVPVPAAPKPPTPPAPPKKTPSANGAPAAPVSVGPVALAKGASTALAKGASTAPAKGASAALAKGASTASANGTSAASAKGAPVAPALSKCAPTAPANGTSAASAKGAAVASAPAVVDDLLALAADLKSIKGVIPISLTSLLNPASPPAAPPPPARMSRQERRALKRKGKGKS
jgi:hypothetical protein